MTKPDILMSALINCNNNYIDKTPIVLQKLKNVTPTELELEKRKFIQLEFNLESGGVNE